MISVFGEWKVREWRILRRGQGRRRHRERDWHDDNIGRNSRATAPVAPTEVASDDPGDHHDREPSECQVKLDSIIGDEPLNEMFHGFYNRKLVRVLHGIPSLSFDDFIL